MARIHINASSHNNGFLLFLVLILNVIKVSTNYPDITGGYSITIGFEENIQEPVNALLLIENIQTSLNTFSGKLWDASRHKFYIKSVDILIPSTWNEVNASNSINHSYGSATIRISSSSDRVDVENPFSCGKPGTFIHLPLTFFNSSDSGRYGPNWKALFNVWATYRWGVHEEHGYIGDLKFPYSHKNLLTDDWEVTSCSDQPISGRYMTNESLSCSASDTLDISSTCRFIPDQSNNATTSLMHFHWIDSIVNFCDETNHNIYSKNRQNALCDHRSVWEVIRETRDFQIVTNPINESPPSVEFKVVQHSKKPSLYILLDRGRIQGSLELANQIPRAVANFLGESLLSSTVAAVGTFPSAQDNDNSIDEEIGWSPLGNNLERFIDAIGQLSIGGPIQRNFPQSILEAANKIKAQAHPNGVVMLVVKYGGDLSSFVNYPPESEVAHALNEAGIILNSIELRIANHTGYAHLSELARQTGGVYTVISNYVEAQTSMSNVFWFMNQILSEDYKELRKNYRTLLKSSITPGSISRFKVPNFSAETESNPGKVEVYFSLNDGSLLASNFLVEGVSTTTGSTIVVDDIVLRKRQDWLENGSKWTYILELSHEKIEPYSEITIQSKCLSCFGTILVRTNIAEAEDVDSNIKLSVFTNFENSTIDVSRDGPIILFVKIFKSDSPVVGADVVAFITEITEQRTTSLRLADNGEGNPDEEIFDGIYSAYFVPAVDGNYKISISVQGSNEGPDFMSNIPTLFGSERPQPHGHGHGRLLPIDQDMGCNGAECDTSVLNGDFMESVDLFGNLRVLSTSNYIPEPTKITTFIISSDQSQSITLLWIAPTVPGRLFSVSSYDVRQSNSQEGLITDFENQEQVPGLSEMKPRAPGSLEILTLPQPALTTFYAIRSDYRGRQSKISDVQAIQIRNEESTTTSATTTLGSSTSSGPTEDTTTVITSTDGSTSSSSSPISTITASTSTTTPQTGSTSESTTVTSTGDTQTPPTSQSPTLSTPAPSKDKKPWAKTGGGIAVITIIVVIVVAAILFAIFYVWKIRASSTGKINPPPQQPRTSIIPM